MKQLLAAVVIVGILSLTGCSATRNPEAERAAVAAAEAWLKLVDAGDYEASWQASSAFFRNAVTREQWEKSMRTFRTPLGGNLSRRIKSRRYRTSLPGAPDGQYVIIRFKSSFAQKKSAVETVTPMLEENGVWHVSGYYIK